MAVAIFMNPNSKGSTSRRLYCWGDSYYLSTAYGGFKQHFQKFLWISWQRKAL